MTMELAVTAWPNIGSCSAMAGYRYIESFKPPKAPDEPFTFYPVILYTIWTHCCRVMLGRRQSRPSRLRRR